MSGAEQVDGSERVEGVLMCLVLLWWVRVGKSVGVGEPLALLERIWE